MAKAKPVRGFTLLELLVVIAIIGVLIALLLPAIQAAREVARRLECQNHLKQLALGCLAHESSVHFLPTGGWGPIWVGDPDLGFGKTQSGGWAFNILPFIELKSTYNLGKGLRGPAKRSALREMIETPLGIYNCPTRRPLIPYLWVDGDQNPGQFLQPKVAGRSDYAINAGTDECASPYFPPPGTPVPIVDFPWPVLDINGVSFQRSTIAIKDITKGTSHTYLAGEKYVDPNNYATGLIDDESLYAGFESDNFRSCLDPPCRDRRGFDIECGFGSAHSAVWNTSFCDGSVRGLSYDIDPAIHRSQGNRHAN